MSKKLSNLSSENERLGRLLAQLQAYSIKVQEQRDALLVQRERLLAVCEVASSWMRDDPRSAGNTLHLLEPFKDAVAELPDQKSA